MKKTLEEYKEKIKMLPLKSKYDKEELLIDELLIEREGNIEIYYAPHNEYLNRKAKVFIVGITPGFQQMSMAISTARGGFEEDKSIEEIQYNCKKEARFSGSLRKNMINMLDSIGLNDILSISSCVELFEDKDYLLHTVSLIPYPVFIKKKNYTGHTPKLVKSEFLMKYVYGNFIDELQGLDGKENILLIPLGKAVEEVLELLAREKLICESQILKGFPHPSGANVNRLKELEKNRERLEMKVKKFLSISE